MKFNIGAFVVDWVYSKQVEGKLKWLPSVGEVSGFVWMAVINVAVILGLVMFAICIF